MGFLGDKYFKQYTLRIFIFEEVLPNFREITK